MIQLWDFATNQPRIVGENARSTCISPITYMRKTRLGKLAVSNFYTLLATGGVPYILRGGSVYNVSRLYGALSREFHVSFSGPFIA